MMQRAFAKLNLTLEILGRSSSRHRVASIFQSVSLADELIFSARKDERVEVEWEAPPSFPIQDNLIERTLRMVQKMEQISAGMQVRVRKRIPIGGGMGGGSSDAAACIPAISVLWGIHKSPKEWMNIAWQLGADVPFFLSGGGTRLLYETTDEEQGNPSQIPDPALPVLHSPFTPLPPLQRLHFVAVYPGFPSFTKSAYEEWDTLSRPTDGIRTQKVANLLKQGKEEEAAQEMCNGFQETLFHLFPGLKSLKERMLESEPRPLNVLFTGSGSCLYAIFDEEEKARASVRRWRSFLPAQVFYLRPVPQTLSSTIEQG